jgi:eukaryotic-like serine/threonine-protein kinase
MTPERVRQIEELYHAAREGTAQERAALLAQALPELRREVESLLRQPSGGEFLDRPAIRNAPHLAEDSTLTGLASGACLGPYRIESKLGEGGMGEVFRAIDTRLGRAVAIKITREQFNARFQREARAISALNHPNICILHDVGPNYFVMELVEGETIAARLKKGPLPEEEAIRYARQIAAALEAAHEKGIIHRDLKPGNVMLTRSGAKVLPWAADDVARHPRLGERGPATDLNRAISGSAVVDGVLHSERRLKRRTEQLPTWDERDQRPEQYLQPGGCLSLGEVAQADFFSEYVRSLDGQQVGASSLTARDRSRYQCADSAT